jgi:hypothetical protein
LRKGNQELQGSLGSTARPCFKNQKRKKIKGSEVFVKCPITLRFNV